VSVPVFSGAAAAPFSAIDKARHWLAFRLCSRGGESASAVAVVVVFSVVLRFLLAQSIHAAPSN